MAREYRRNSYVYGSAAPELNPRREVGRPPQRVYETRRKNKSRKQVMTFGFVAFLTAALFITGFTCIEYIKLQSSITNYVGTISSLEIELQELKASNDDMESRIKGSVCLEDIKKRAMDDLGMTYARQDQIVVYESDGTDYVRQFVSIE